MKARITYALPETNPGKLEKLAALQSVYRAYVQVCIDVMVAAKCHLVKQSDRQTFFPKSTLSSQLQKCARGQAADIVSTWVKTLYSRLKDYITEQDLSASMKHQLYIVGKYLLVKPTKTKKIDVTEEAISTWWGWVWDTAVAGNTPRVRDNLPMWFSEMCIDFEVPRKADSHGGWWAKVSCLENGKRVTIPLAPTPYLTDALKVAKSVLVGKRYGRWFFQFTDKTPVEEFEITDKKIGLDVGLNVLAATSDGRLLGKTCKPKFNKLYKKINKTRKNRMRQGLPHNSPRLDKMEQRLTGLVKTEAGKAVNKLVKAYPKFTFVIEDLDLSGCKGSKRFAYRILHRILSNRAAVQGVIAAYSSQPCPSCGYVNKGNRNGTKFKCLSCGRISHADVVGGINLLGRSEDKQISAIDDYKSVGRLLKERYRDKRNSSSGHKQRAHTVVPAAYCDSGSHIAKNTVIVLKGHET